MIQHTFSAEGFERTDKLQKYVEQKVKDFEKYIPRFARQSAKLTIRTERHNKSKTEMYTCTVTLELPEETLQSSEKVEHSYSALDVAMAEMKRQVTDYKERRGQQSIHRRTLKALRSRFGRH